MQIEKITLDETHQFSSLLIDYLTGSDVVQPFYALPPRESSFEKQIAMKQLDPEMRNTLAEVLEGQYETINTTAVVKQNIAALRSKNTYTITTGHQLNIFTGPMYFIYKIITVINIADKLTQQYPGHHFVPVYWMASEDHDFEEINHFRLFGNEYKWESDQIGPVGRMSPRSIGQLMEQLPDIPRLFEKAYLNNNTLADATRQVVNELFQNQGLVVLDSDDARLKASLAPALIDDITMHSANTIVNRTTALLEERGYKSQVYPRLINFFYMEDGLRERIVEVEGGSYTVLNSDITFSRGAMETEMQLHPEKFSPNVIMRPLYQEIILPNLAYVGGPAEVAYWLQLKGVFEHYKIPFPILMPRNFAMIINKPLVKKLKKLELTPVSLFNEPEQVKTEFLRKHAAQTYTLDREKDALQEVYREITNKATLIDGSLKGFIGAEETKMLKAVENIEKRLKRSEEIKQETELKQISNLLEKLFPDGSPQERVDNFLNFYINNPDLLNMLKENLEPFDYRYHVFLDNE